MRWAALPLLLASLAGCAPTSIAPSIIRLPAHVPGKRELRVGVRTGPRLSVAAPNFESGAFPGDGADFDVPNWSLAYDLLFTFPVTDVVALHVGGQGEFYYPVPLPAVGGTVGISALWRVGPFSIGPAAALRGCTLFGLAPLPLPGATGGVGELLAADLSLTLSVEGDSDSRFAIAPFVSVNWVPSANVPGPMWYAGAMFVVRVKNAEVMGGVARVVLPDGRSWNVPLLGIQGGEN